MLGYLTGVIMNEFLIEALKHDISMDINIIDIKKIKEPFNFVRFGKKKFERIQVDYSLNNQDHKLTLIRKSYPDLDIPMMITNDHSFREIRFVNSPIRKTFSRFYDIPIMYVDEENHALYMRDCSDDLKKFGPPSLPTEIQMKNLITRTAIKDAKLMDTNWDFAHNYYDIFDFMHRAFNEKLTAQEMKKLKAEWPWFVPGINNLKNCIGTIRYEKLKTIYNPDKVKTALSKVPFTLHHGDLYFANIGFNTENKPLVIDWELICRGPIGFDFVILTNGIPPLHFSDLYEEWYISAFNNASDQQINMKQFLKWTELIRNHHFLVTETIDYIRFSFNKKEDDDDSEAEAKQNNYIRKLDLILKVSPKKITG